ncbi:hypothetical protein CIW48_32965, partial [Methylobacterium sp. P1-11]|uniref:hypothetical protein n=1 Tax=Methylobacterium sp. P1-11 TaxID=2024616 RepID=UPI0012597FD6
WKFQLELISYPCGGFAEEEQQYHFMLVHLKDQTLDWINAGHRRTAVMLFFVSGLLLAPVWMTIGLYILIRHDLLGEGHLTFWIPIFLGMAGCFFLPTERLSTRLLIAIAYAPVTVVFLVGFSITVGCLMIGSCL